MRSDKQGRSQRSAGREQDIMSNKMWGGRFSERPDEIMEEINVSIDVDRHLYAQDIAASKAHAAMLASQGIINGSNAINISRGLDTINSQIGKFWNV
jgi:argininosuccinate lyase